MLREEIEFGITLEVVIIVYVKWLHGDDDGTHLIKQTTRTRGFGFGRLVEHGPITKGRVCVTCFLIRTIDCFHAEIRCIQTDKPY